MQLERKRKAATFLAQLAERKTTVSSVQPVEGVCFGHFKCVCQSVNVKRRLWKLYGILPMTNAQAVTNKWI